MANFTINFQANTTGDHYVGWRTYDMAPNTYNVETVAVAAPGAQAVQIDVAGNLYCMDQDIRYNGYVIAACMAQDDVLPPTGIPDLALIWSLDMVQQTDPCIKTDITCESVAVASTNVTLAGTGYTDGEVVTVVEATPGDEVVAAVIHVAETGGIIDTLDIITPGLYKATPTLDLTGIGNGDATGTVTLDTDCPSLDLGDHDCEGQYDLSDTPDHVIPHTSTETICADVTTLGGMAANFATSQVGNCHCEECLKVDIDATGSASGSGKITYATCWDGSNGLGSLQMVTQTVPFGSTLDLGCIIPSTMVIDQGDLDVSFTTNSVACP